LLKDAVVDNGEANAFVTTIIEAIDRGKSLTSRLLAFSRQSMLTPVATDVSGLIGSLEDMLRRTLGETIDLRVMEAPALWLATIDPHQFENALINLAINARDAMPLGGTLIIESAAITLDEAYAAQQTEVTPGDYIVVSVSDTGAGMPPEVLEKVFEPFFTTKEVGKGSDLGLSMVFGFAMQSKGHLSIFSEVGCGTTVKLYLPRSGKDAAQDSPMEKSQEFVRGSARILLVEDDESLREVPVRMLRRQGYEVVEARNGEEAIKRLSADGPFDLLFTDVVLPGGMNGVEIAAQAKRGQPDIKVLYTTGYSENAVVHNGQLDPGVTLISKPYRRQELLEIIHSVFDGDPSAST
jgi:CheY-like chemotaxis protein